MTPRASMNPAKTTDPTARASPKLQYTASKEKNGQQKDGRDKQQHNDPLKNKDDSKNPTGNQPDGQRPNGAHDQRSNGDKPDESHDEKKKQKHLHLGKVYQKISSVTRTNRTYK